MPRAKFFRNHPVKKMKNVRPTNQEGTDTIHLILYAADPGVPGRQLRITQAEWKEHGELREVEDSGANALRALVSKSELLA